MLLDKKYVNDISDYIDIITLKNLIVTCHHYYQYKSMLIEKYEYCYKHNIFRSLIGCPYIHPLESIYIKSINLYISIHEIFLDVKRQSKEYLTLREVKHPDKSNVSYFLMKNKRLRRNNSIEKIQELSKIFYFIILYFLDFILRKNKLDLSQIKYIIFQGIKHPILTVLNNESEGDLREIHINYYQLYRNIIGIIE
jgi:hypothetical protein